MSKNYYNKLFKKRYCISFYETNDDTLVHVFDNLREICKYRNMKPTIKNINMLNVELYRALKREDHATRMLDGITNMKVHLIDLVAYDEEESKNTNEEERK